MNPSFLSRLRGHIKHLRQCFIGYPNTLNFVRITPLRVVLSTLFSVFRYPDETLSRVFDKLHQTRKTASDHISDLLKPDELLMNLSIYFHFTDVMVKLLFSGTTPPAPGKWRGRELISEQGISGNSQDHRWLPQQARKLRRRNDVHRFI